MYVWKQTRLDRFCRSPGRPTTQEGSRPQWAAPPHLADTCPIRSQQQRGGQAAGGFPAPRPAAPATPQECMPTGSSDAQAIVPAIDSPDTDYVPCAQGSPRSTSKGGDVDSSPSCEFPQMIWKRARK